MRFFCGRSFWCCIGLHKWFTFRIGSDDTEYGVPASWGTTSCTRPGCDKHFNWVNDE
jgi:hypothetical protein